MVQKNGLKYPLKQSPNHYHHTHHYRHPHRMPINPSGRCHGGFSDENILNLNRHRRWCSRLSSRSSFSLILVGNHWGHRIGSNWRLCSGNRGSSFSLFDDSVPSRHSRCIRRTLSHLPLSISRLSRCSRGLLARNRKRCHRRFACRRRIILIRDPPQVLDVSNW